MTTGSLQIIEPLAVSATNATYPGTTLANILTADPKEIYQSTSAGLQDIALDFGAPVTIDSLFFGFTNLQPGIQVRFNSFTSIAAAGPALQASGYRAADAKSVRGGILLKAAAPFTSRYAGVTVDANSGVPLQIGRIAAGLSFEASWDREWGSGRRPIDTAKVTQLVGGGFGVQPGARKAAYNWTFGDLTDAETEQLYGIAYRVGNSSPIIVNEQDGATVGANEKLHYGLLQRFDAFERREPSATKWQLEIEEWV